MAQTPSFPESWILGSWLRADKNENKDVNGCTMGRWIAYDGQWNLFDRCGCVWMDLVLPFGTAVTVGQVLFGAYRNKRSAHLFFLSRDWGVDGWCQDTPGHPRILRAGHQNSRLQVRSVEKPGPLFALRSGSESAARRLASAM